MKEFLIGAYSALLLTVAIEITAAVLLKIRSKHDILHIVLINCVTNPLLTVLLTVIVSVSYKTEVLLLWILISEAAVVFFEALYYKKMLENKSLSPFLISFILNIFSIVAGIAVYYFLFRY